MKKLGYVGGELEVSVKNKKRMLVITRQQSAWILKNQPQKRYNCFKSPGRPQTVQPKNYEVIMNHTDSPDTPKKTRKNKDAGKSPQELYDKYLKKGDEAIIAEDIVVAEKYYQHADYYLRCMNDPQHCGNTPLAPRTQPSAFPLSPSVSPHSIEALIQKALKGISAERAARKEAFLEKVREVARVAKTARNKKKKAKAKKAKVAQGKDSQGEQTTQGNNQKVDKKHKIKDEPCKIIPLHPTTAPAAEVEQQT